MTATENFKVGTLLTITESSGGVLVNSSGGGTIYGGGSSVASRSVTARSDSEYSHAPRIRDDDTSSVASSRTTTTRGFPIDFNPKNYGDPGLRPSGSVVSSNSPKGKSQFARVRAAPTKIHSDASRLQQQGMKKTRRPAKGLGDEDERPSSESEGEEISPSPKTPARRAQTAGTLPDLKI